MSDKPTSDTGHAADNDFTLNHFDLHSDASPRPPQDGDLFAATQPEQQSSDVQSDPYTDPFGAPIQNEKIEGDDKAEPIVPRAFADDDAAPDTIGAEAATATVAEPPVDHATPRSPNDASKPVMPPRDGHQHDAPEPAARGRLHPITLFAVGAMLMAAIAVWMNAGSDASDDQSESATPAATASSALVTDIQLRRLETRLSALEEQSAARIDALQLQIAALQQQLDKMNPTTARRTSALAPQHRRPATVKSVSHSTASASLTPVRSQGAVGWVVNLASVDSKTAAQRTLARYRALGIPAELFPVTIKGKPWYRLRIAGFASRQEAETQRRYLAHKHGIKDAWIQKP